MTDGHTQRLESALAGRYKIQKKLGEGGMASVYLAEDIKHERKVALKILKPELAAVIGAERFLAEIKTTANLQHPHILPLFDSGESDGFLYYVMPYIEGETLRDRIEREQQLGVDEAVRIARDVADALDYAHRNDIIHRDIKPANILLHDGRPVVADFGIALAISAAGGGRMTETGLSLGTPHYMSPEQASADRDLSARSDVYSLGCVLYEMLAGQPPHTGPSAQSILVRILTEDPRDVTELRRTVPSNVAATVMKAIEKLPADRFDTARQFMEALQDPAFAYAPAVRAKAAAPRPTRGAPVAAGPSRTWMAATVVVAAVAAAAGWMLGPGQAPPAVGGPVTSFVLAEEFTSNHAPMVASDGSIVFYDLARGGGLWLRAAGSLDEVPLEGANVVGGSGDNGAFSPDGRWFAFIEDDGTGGKVRRMPARGGPVSTLWSGSDSSEAQGTPEWSDDGWIYIYLTGALARIPEDGGPADTLLATSAQAITRIESFPRGRGIAFTLRGRSGAHVVLMDLATRDTTTLVNDGFDARYVNSGHLIYAHEAGALYAMPFDARRMEPTGPAVPVIEDLAVNGMYSRYDVSSEGTLVYAQGPASGNVAGGLTFGRVTAEGITERYSLEGTDHDDAALSPDGRMLAYTRGGAIWLYDTELGSNVPLSAPSLAETAHGPVWSPDGRQIVYQSELEGDSTSYLYVQDADGSDDPRRLEGTERGRASQWLEDGTILYSRVGGVPDVFSVSSTGAEAPKPLLRADWAEHAPRVSPDGRWLAFLSSENGRAEVHLRRWPALTGKVEVPPVGGLNTNSRLVWSLDGHRLFYTGVRNLMEVTLGNGDPPEASVRDTGVPTRLVQDNHPDGSILVTLGVNAAGDDGARATRGLVAVSNWLTALRERLGEGKR
ncbi:MAG TPA: protein kinase [Longimicrobiales bacterium]|nr:protein kinase [Longimicrobiales bacterium]